MTIFGLSGNSIDGNEASLTVTANGKCNLEMTNRNWETCIQAGDDLIVDPLGTVGQYSGYQTIVLM